MTRSRTFALVAAAGAALLPATAAGEPPRATAAATTTVVLKDIAFRPGSVGVRRGDTVRWVWRDGTTRHNVVFRRSSVRSAVKSQGSYRRTFRRRGTFAYVCTLHPGMDGKVVVR